MESASHQDASDERASQLLFVEAFSLIQKNNYALILMDIQMPLMDGVELTQKIRTYEREKGETSRIIIVVTANAMVGDRKRYLDQGLNDYPKSCIGNLKWEGQAMRGLDFRGN
ncbi:MAG: response regulator, partial [Verrucomicrobiota bacterium]